MDPEMIKNLALGSITPLIIALVCFAIIWRKRPAPAPALADTERPARIDWRLVAVPLVLSLASVVTYVIVMGMPHLPAWNSMEWMPYIALGAGLAGAVASIERLPVFIRWSPTLLALVCAWWASARQLIANTWTTEQSAAELLDFLVPAVVAIAAAVVLTRRAAVTSVLVLVILVGSTAQLLILGFHSMRQGQVVGMTAASLIAAVGIAVWRRGFRVGPGGVVFAVVMLMAGLFQSRLYGQATHEMARAYSSLILFSVVAATLVYTWAPERQPRVRAIAALIALTLPLILGTAYAAKNYFAEMAQEQYGRAPAPAEALPVASSC